MDKTYSGIPLKFILVTGGSGYIGSHVVAKLLAENYKIVVVDNEVNSYPLNLKIKAYYKVDINDFNSLEVIFKKYKFTSIIHLAGLISVPESVREPEQYYKTNLWGGWNLLILAKQYQIKNFIFSSTAAVYGIPKQLPITENTATNPINPYGNSKLAFEKILVDVAKVINLNYIILRYFNVAGNDTELKLPYHPKKPASHIIPVLVKQIKTNKPFTIYGTDYATRDGTAIRDYVHVIDLANAHLQALKYLFRNQSSKIGETLNVGLGRGYSVKEIITLAEKTLGKKINTKLENRREGDPPQLYVKNSKLLQLLAWKAQFGLADMLKSAYESESLS